MIRRTWAQIWFAMIMALAVTAGCGGGGGGGGAAGGTGGTGGGSTIGFVKQFGPIDSDWSTFPFDDVYDTKTQYLYTAEEIGGSGKITKIRFKQFAETANEVTCPNTTVKMGHTTVSSLTYTWADNVGNGAGAEQTVLNNATVTIPAASTSALALRWIEITFDTPFYYNGVDNLVVDIERTTVCSDVSGPAFVATTANYSTDRRAYSFEFDLVPGTAENNTVNADLVDNKQPWMQFVFEGGDNTQDYGGSSPAGAPFVSSAPLRMQSLYLASDINGSGQITGIAFQTYATLISGITRTYTYTMTLSHATVMTLGNTFANNYAGTKTIVASAVTFTVPAGIPGGDWFWVPISSGTFTYNGYDNLIVEVATTSGSDDVALMSTTRPGSGQRLLAFGSTTAATGVVGDVVLHAKLRFNGGPVSVITDGVVSTSNTFNTGGAGMLNLYRATELGTGGTINSIACRLYSDATATSYSNYKVIIGHSKVDTLDVTTANNFVSSSTTTAMSGTVTVPTGLLAGDWLEIPLSTPFIYDGVSNLAIWMGTTAASGASADTICRMSTADSILYTGNAAAGTPGASAVTPQDNKFDIKLKITK
jgi:hypothetical protein